MELHLLRVHLKRVASEIQSLREVERNIQAHSKGILNGAQSVIDGLIPQFDKVPEIHIPLEELSASLSREAGLQGDPRHTERMLDEIQRLASAKLEIPMSNIDDQELQASFVIAKKASLDVLVDMESKLSRRFARS
jgi:hypothetical protein